MDERVTVHVDRDLHKEIKKWAIDQDLEVGEAYDIIISRHIAQHIGDK